MSWFTDYGIEQELKPECMWKGTVTQGGIPYKVNVFRDRSGRFSMYGSHGECHRLHDFVAENKFTFERIGKDGFLVILPSFEMVLKEQGRFYEMGYRGSGTPFPVKVKFVKVEWSKVSCPIQDSLCTGMVSFYCEQHIVEKFEEEVDEPVLVSIKEN